MTMMTVDEFSTYIEDNVDKICVFASVRGKWGMYKLSELPSKEAVKAVTGFYKDRKIPITVTLSLRG